MRWEEASRTNYTSGRAGAIRRIVVHATHGSYRGAISWFRTPGAKVSSHYVIRASDGEITQMVREADTAWHARGGNRDTIGIEHEYDPRAIAFTDAQYRASAELVCSITRRYGLRADRATVIGHVEVPGSDHTDPGRTWNWTHYMGLITRCSGGGGAAPGGAAGSFTGAAAVPPVGLDRGMSGAAVSSLQDRLVRLGFLRPSDAATRPGFFGQFTEAALMAFQRANGVPATGYYGPRDGSRHRRGGPVPAALGRRTLGFGLPAADPPAVPRAHGRGDWILRTADGGGCPALPSSARCPGDGRLRPAHARRARQPHPIAHLPGAAPRVQRSGR